MSAGRTIVALSGGVDSSVAALLLSRAGEPVSALFMKNWEGDDEDGYCAAEADVADALDVCEQLGLALNTVNLASTYYEEVFTPFLADYAAGRTPNPDIECNRSIKFKAFLEHVAALGADYVATGHYARVARRDDGYALLRGVDPGKDQSYFLYTLGQAELARVRFPIGHLHKAEVRRLAGEAGLPVHAKKDSTGICFIGERPFRDFLAGFLKPRPGPIRTTSGQTVGEHAGVHFYTLGQRQGLGIGGVRGAIEGPWYVVARDIAGNVLTVAQEHDHPLLLSHALLADRLSWVAGTPPPLDSPLTARVRYRQGDQACRITTLDGDSMALRFERPQRAVSPGQSVVLYDGERCLGGGVVTATDAG